MVVDGRFGLCIFSILFVDDMVFGGVGSSFGFFRFFSGGGSSFFFFGFFNGLSVSSRVGFGVYGVVFFDYIEGSINDGMLGFDGVVSMFFGNFL